MRLTKSAVTRGLVLLEPDDSGVLETVRVVATVVLARCTRCGSRRRVLPCDALPHKTFGMPAIEQQVARYSRGDRSLRQVAWRQLGERTPSHTTLHAWTEGLGAWSLGRAGGEVPDADPFAAVLEETRRRWPARATAMDLDVWVDPRRYRSQPRRERLAAVVRVLATARSVAGAAAGSPLCTWRRRCLEFGLSSPIAFRTGISDTPIEHRDRRSVPSSRPTSPREGHRCQTRSRSPPGATSR